MSHISPWTPDCTALHLPESAPEGGVKAKLRPILEGQGRWRGAEIQGLSRDVLIHGLGGGGGLWWAPPPRPNHPKPEKIPLGKNKILNREPKNRGPI